MFRVFNNVQIIRWYQYLPGIAFIILVCILFMSLLKGLGFWDFPFWAGIFRKLRVEIIALKNRTRKNICRVCGKRILKRSRDKKNYCDKSGKHLCEPAVYHVDCFIMMVFEASANLKVQGEEISNETVELYEG